MRRATRSKSPTLNNQISPSTWKPWMVKKTPLPSFHQIPLCRKNRRSIKTTRILIWRRSSRKPSNSWCFRSPRETGIILSSIRCRMSTRSSTRRVLCQTTNFRMSWNRRLQKTSTSRSSWWFPIGFWWQEDAQQKKHARDSIKRSKPTFSWRRICKKNKVNSESQVISVRIRRWAILW